MVGGLLPFKTASLLHCHWILWCVWRHIFTGHKVSLEKHNLFVFPSYYLYLLNSSAQSNSLKFVICHSFLCSFYGFVQLKNYLTKYIPCNLIPLSISVCEEIGKFIKDWYSKDIGSHNSPQWGISMFIQVILYVFQWNFMVFYNELHFFH